MKTVAIAGFGFMGSMHAQVYQSLPNARLAAIADSRPDAARQTAAKLGLAVPIHPNLETLLEKENVDVIDVCLPTDLHAAAALRVIERGKDFFCEKPLALTVEDAEKITTAARKRGVRFMVGHCIRFWPEYQAFFDFARGGQAGRLLSLSMQRRAGRPLGSSDNWLQDEKRSLGCVVDLHIHDTDFVHHLLGAPKSVSSRGTRDFAGWSHIFTDYEFPGLVVQAEGGWNYPAKWGFQMAFQAVFEKGTVEYDSRAASTLTLTLGAATPVPLPFKAPTIGASAAGQGNISSLGGYQLELEYFIDCLERGIAPALSTGEQATQSLRVCLAEIESCATGRRITL